jgi:hypothetical protein
MTLDISRLGTAILFQHFRGRVVLARLHFSPARTGIQAIRLVTARLFLVDVSHRVWGALLVTLIPIIFITSFVVQKTKST